MQHADIKSADQGWAVVSTHPHRELLAQTNLARQGFEPYCPQIRKLIRHARRESEQLRPLFPGYIFVRADIDRWRPILSTLGVRTLVRCGDQPSLLNGRFIDALKAREIEGAIAQPERPFIAGQRVRIAGGPFEGLTATILGLNEKERVSVLLDMLMRSVKVSVSEHDLVAV